MEFFGNSDKQIDFLKDQVRLRDKIVKEQNVIINDVMNNDKYVKARGIENYNRKRSIQKIYYDDEPAPAPSTSPDQLEPRQSELQSINKTKNS